MDGSLLDDEKRIHDDFWPLLDELDGRGILLCPASGRQYATLRRQFARDELVYIAENGSYVVQHDEEISVGPPRPRPRRRAVVEAVRAADGLDLGTVLCGKRSAYVERTDDAFLDQARPYYARLETVDDLTAVDDEVLKVAVYDFGTAADGAGPLLEPFAARPAGVRQALGRRDEPDRRQGSRPARGPGEPRHHAGADDGVRRLLQRRRHARRARTTRSRWTTRTPTSGRTRGSSPRRTPPTAWSAPSVGARASDVRRRPAADPRLRRGPRRRAAGRRREGRRPAARAAARPPEDRGAARSRRSARRPRPSRRRWASAPRTSSSAAARSAAACARWPSRRSARRRARPAVLPPAPAGPPGHPPHRAPAGDPRPGPRRLGLDRPVRLARRS